MDSQIEEIKNKLNVLDIVGGYVKLSKTGVNWRGVCPFHSEKGPSFFVSPARQMWHCFGCGVGGDIFEFIKKIEGIEFGDALRILASKAGVELKRENPQLISDRKKLYEICDLSCSFFEKQLESSEWGKKAKEYLLKRGIKDETIKKWRLGYSPDTWQSLSDFLVGRGYTRDEIIKGGLAVQSEKNNNPYDRFRGRIIFPIFDLNSQVIGFSARIFKDDQKGTPAKYINTPQTLLYDKSNVLYGINFAKLPIRKMDCCVLTEGNTDAIMCHQAGFENTVAVSGTALTPMHLNLLKRYSNNLLLAFDMDSAGETATKRGINLAESQGFNIKVIDTYSGAKDPAEIILDNPKNWEASVGSARTIMDFYFDSAFAKFDKKTPEGKKEIGKIILPAIKRLVNKIEQSFWIQKLADMLGVNESAVREELSSLRGVSVASNEAISTNGIVASPASRNDVTSRKELLEKKIIYLILKNPEGLNLLKEENCGLFSEQNRKFIDDIKKGENNDALSVFLLKAETEFGEDGQEELELCINHLKDIELRNIMQGLSKEMKNETVGEKEEKLKEEFNKKAKELHGKK